MRTLAAAWIALRLSYALTCPLICPSYGYVMPLRQRLENLPVGQKLLAALLVLLATVLVVANLTFVSVAYWISTKAPLPKRCKHWAAWPLILT